MQLDKDIVVFYHGTCRDGFTAAWAAWKKFGADAVYIPLVWTNLMPEQIPDVSGKEVYFLDFCPEQDELDRVLRQAKKVIIIDHHVSREKETQSVPGSVYDINHSGGYLAWKYFHPDIPMPQICLYTEDSDLWKWSISGSAEVLNFFDLKREFDFNVWDSLAQDLEDEAIRKEYYEKGKLLIAFREKITHIIIKEQTQLVEFEGYEVYASNAPRFFKSEIGSELARKKPPFGIVWNYTDKEISVSLRSGKDFNLVPLAEKFNGGGHEHACNFRLPLGAPLPWKVIKSYNE